MSTLHELGRSATQCTSAHNPRVPRRLPLCDLTCQCGARRHQLCLSRHWVGCLCSAECRLACGRSRGRRGFKVCPHLTDVGVRLGGSIILLLTPDTTAFGDGIRVSSVGGTQRHVLSATHTCLVMHHGMDGRSRGRQCAIPRFQRFHRDSIHIHVQQALQGN